MNRLAMSIYHPLCVDKRGGFCFWFQMWMYKSLGKLCGVRYTLFKVWELDFPFSMQEQFGLLHVCPHLHITALNIEATLNFKKVI